MTLHCRLSVRHYTPHETQASHEHDHVQVSMILRGGVMEAVGREAQAGTPLSVVMKGAGVAHANTFGPTGAMLLQLAFPLDALDPVLDSPSRAEPWRWLHHPAVARPFVRLLRSMSETTHTVTTDDPDLTDILAAITARPAPTRAQPPTWLIRVRDRIEHDWVPGDTVATLAADAGVHPVYLARAMRRWFGLGVATQLRRARTRAAARGVAMGGCTLSRVAHGSGFADEPHLCRDFGHAVGLSPGRFRRLLSRFDPSIEPGCTDSSPRRSVG